jgi:hypothetical protein
MTMTNYIVRSIDRRLWREVKKRAAADDLSLRSVILALLRGYAAGALTIAAMPAPPAEGGR